MINIKDKLLYKQCFLEIELKKGLARKIYHQVFGNSFERVRSQVRLWSKLTKPLQNQISTKL